MIPEGGWSRHGLTPVDRGRFGVVWDHGLSPTPGDTVTHIDHPWLAEEVEEPLAYLGEDPGPSRQMWRVRIGDREARWAVENLRSLGREQQKAVVVGTMRLWGW